MLNPNQNNRDQPKLTDRKPLTIRMSYIPDLAGKISDAINFILMSLNFQLEEEMNFDKMVFLEPITLQDSNGKTITLIIKELENDPEIQHIIVHTDDCLRDYHKYLIAGIEFVNRPEYTAAGLQVDFLGHNDRYTLLEERTYTESL
ncbi:hypothetical protein SAMN05421813_102212 [Daejeonella rubra]|uniref:VOC domain-containing protein n=1 Tax=Daejeonella rubra TaxID=990371 RepID=A0A1G9N2T3_9SPHI|nr:hypothetical protein [Daejeonella rubra]SDL80799.1 hypothetical protein SAMN05421813_102212 [Daejeonella rubra]